MVAIVVSHFLFAAMLFLVENHLLQLKFLPNFLLQYSYELLLQYLQKTQALVMLGIINERITFEGTIPQFIQIITPNVYHAFAHFQFSESSLPLFPMQYWQYPLGNLH